LRGKGVVKESKEEEDLRKERENAVFIDRDEL